MASPKPPIEHLSYSALMCFLRNPAEFERIYVKKQYREKQAPAAVVGKAFHKCMEFYYKGHSKEQALEMGFQLVHDVEHLIDFGETGSLEKVLRDYRKTVEHYYKDGEKFVRFDHVISSEYTFRAAGISPVPLKSVTDLILREPGISEPTIVDFKKVTTFTKRDKDGKFILPPAYLIQSVFNYLTVKGTMGVAPRKMVFLEVKTGENKNPDEPLAQEVTINMASPEYAEECSKVLLLISNVLKLISNPKISSILYNPNVQDMMTGEESWAEWSKSLD